VKDHGDRTEVGSGVASDKRSDSRSDKQSNRNGSSWRQSQKRHTARTIRLVEWSTAHVGTEEDDAYRRADSERRLFDYRGGFVGYQESWLVSVSASMTAVPERSSDSAASGPVVSIVMTT